MNNKLCSPANITNTSKINGKSTHLHSRRSPTSMLISTSLTPPSAHIFHSPTTCQPAREMTHRIYCGTSKQKQKSNVKQSPICAIGVDAEPCNAVLSDTVIIFTSPTTGSHHHPKGLAENHVRAPNKYCLFSFTATASQKRAAANEKITEEEKERDEKRLKSGFSFCS